MHRWRQTIAVVSAALLLALALIVRAEPPATDVTHEPAHESFLLVPLSVHVLSAKDDPAIDCKLTDADITQIVGKVNGIWHKAGIHFCLDKVLHEEAADVAAFAEKRAATATASLADFRLLAPRESRTLPGLHVYYVHELPPNGVYLGSNVCFVKETAALRKVEGGIDEPLPRVTAHELGHGLSLPHRQDVTNLMASGTTGTLLNAREVEQTRARAKKIAGVMTIDQCKAAVEAAKSKSEDDHARSLERYLNELEK